MFDVKKQEKLHLTDLTLYNNKRKLDELQDFDPFQIIILNGLQVLSLPRFEPYYKVIQSLKVVDENDHFLASQTESLKKDIVATSKKETFLELLYLPESPEEERYFSLLEEKFLLNLVNLTLDRELPMDRSLNSFEIETAESTFKQMLQNA